MRSFSLSPPASTPSASGFSSGAAAAWARKSGGPETPSRASSAEGSSASPPPPPPRLGFGPRRGFAAGFGAGEASSDSARSSESLRTAATEGSSSSSSAEEYWSSLQGAVGSRPHAHGAAVSSVSLGVFGWARIDGLLWVASVMVCATVYLKWALRAIWAGLTRTRTNLIWVQKS